MNEKIRFLLKRMIMVYEKIMYLKKAFLFGRFRKVNLTKQQKRSIDDFYIKNYGKKISYIEHREFLSYSNKFNEKYIPCYLVIGEFNRLVNFSNNIPFLTNKANLELVCKSMNVNTPKNIYRKINCDLYLNECHDFISRNEFIKKIKNIGEVFVKPSEDTCGGKGCKLLKIKNGIDCLTNKNAIEILDEYKKGFLMQKRLKQSDLLASVYEKSINTFRVTTLNWKNNIVFLPSFMRFGNNGNIDNLSSGGLMVFIDENGKLSDSAVDYDNNIYFEHPSSGRKFGFVIPQFNDIKKTAKKMHMCFPQIGLIDWDFTLNDNNEVTLIEANIGRGGSCRAIQRLTGEPYFGDLTGEILQWMKYKRYHPEEETDFGNIN